MANTDLFGDRTKIACSLIAVRYNEQTASGCFGRRLLVNGTDALISRCHAATRLGRARTALTLTAKDQHDPHAQNRKLYPVAAIELLDHCGSGKYEVC